jgi:hypothetical protein
MRSIAVQQLLLGALSGLDLEWPKAEFRRRHAERELVAPLLTLAEVGSWSG